MKNKSNNNVIKFQYVNDKLFLIVNSECYPISQMADTIDDTIELAKKIKRACDAFIKENSKTSKNIDKNVVFNLEERREKLQQMIEKTHDETWKKRFEERLKRLPFHHEYVTNTSSIIKERSDALKQKGIDRLKVCAEYNKLLMPHIKKYNEDIEAKIGIDDYKGRVVFLNEYNCYLSADGRHFIQQYDDERMWRWSTIYLNEIELEKRKLKFKKGV